MMTPVNPLSTETGDDLKRITALRIAMNIAVADKALAAKAPERWLIDDLYDYLERAWFFFWNEREQIWAQQ